MTKRHQTSIISTTIKSLALGTAAGFVALSGAQAADLPVKAKAVEYVKICSLYGAGFYYIPGTDTCIRIGGAIRIGITFNGTILGRAVLCRAAPAAPIPTTATISAHANALYLNIDTRTANRIRRCPHLRQPAVRLRAGPRKHRGRLCRERLPLHPVRRLHLR